MQNGKRWESSHIPKKRWMDGKVSDMKTAKT